MTIQEKLTDVENVIRMLYYQRNWGGSEVGIYIFRERTPAPPLRGKLRIFGK